MTKMKPKEQQEMSRDAILGYYPDYSTSEELLGVFDALLKDAVLAEGPRRIQETSYGNGFLLIQEGSATTPPARARRYDPDPTPPSDADSGL